jgi:hypothetical protein
MQKGSMSPEFREPHRHGDPVVADERGVVWIAPPHDHDASVPSPARASAGFGAFWFPRQVSHVRGRLVVAPSRPGSGLVGSRANVFPRACAACSGYRGREVDLGFVAGQRPLQGHGGLDELGLLRLVEVALSTRRGLGGVPGGSRDRGSGSRFGERLAGQLPTSRLVGGGENLPAHTGCAQRARPLPFVWYDLLGLTEPCCGQARAADARSPGGVAHGPGPAADTTGSWRRGCRSVRFDGGGWWRPPRWRGPLGVGPPRPRFGA